MNVAGNLSLLSWLLQYGRTATDTLGISATHPSFNHVKHFTFSYNFMLDVNYVTVSSNQCLERVIL